MESALETKLMSFNKTDMIQFLESNPDHFEEALQLALADKQPYSWRSAFLLSNTVILNDIRIKKRIADIIKAIPKMKDGHQRELLKILYNMEINEKHEGHIFDLCMNIWEQINKSPSVRMIALKFIIRIVNIHPELKEEISIISQDHYLESLSPGIKSSVKKLLNEYHFSTNK